MKVYLVVKTYDEICKQVMSYRASADDEPTTVFMWKHQAEDFMDSLTMGPSIVYSLHEVEV